MAISKGFQINQKRLAVWENAKPLMWMEKEAISHANYSTLKGSTFHYEHLYRLHHSADPDAFRDKLQEKLLKYDTLGQRFPGCTWKITLAASIDWDGKDYWLVTFHLKIK